MVGGGAGRRLEVDAAVANPDHPAQLGCYLSKNQAIWMSAILTAFLPPLLESPPPEALQAL